MGGEVMELGKLSAAKVEKTKQAGMYGDGGGLWLQVRAPHVKSWIFRYTLNGKARAMGLGPVGTVSLADARRRAAEARVLLLDGKDPIADRDADRAKRKLAAANSITFKECAAAYIQQHKAGWRSAKHGEQWTNTLAAYAEPVFGALPVQSIDTGLVMRVLQPIWTTKPETAARLRGRIEKVLDWARVQGYREGENPARWRGHLEALLPKRSKVARVEHHAALPYRQMGEFMAELREQEGTAARALELAILTAARKGEVIGARWAEVNLDEALWTIPAVRTKTHKEHRVPLAPASIAVLEKMRERSEGEFVFPGARPSASLSEGAMRALLERMARTDITPHGFRSAFRDWAAEQTAFPREVAEMALGHAVGNQVEAAYRRGDLREKRRKLMEAWAAYCAAPAKSGKVVHMRRASE
jgi:integrase